MMGFGTVAAVLDAVFKKSKVTTAAASQGIERTKAEQAIKIRLRNALMTGEIFTIFILAEFVMFHMFIPLSMDNQTAVHG